MSGIIDLSAEDYEVKEEEVEEGYEIPTVMTNAVKIIHPMFVSETGQHLPPPPDHKYQVSLQISIGVDGRPLIEAPGLFFFSGNDEEEITEAIVNVVKGALEEVRVTTSAVKIATPDEVCHFTKDT